MKGEKVKNGKKENCSTAERNFRIHLFCKIKYTNFFRYISIVMKDKLNPYGRLK